MQNPLQTIQALTSGTKDKKQLNPEDWFPLAEKMSQEIPLSPEACFVLAHAFIMNCDDEDFSLTLLAKHMDCAVIPLLEFVPHIESLKEAGWLEQQTGFRKKESHAARGYRLHAEVMEALVYGKSVELPGPPKVTDVFDLLKEICALPEKRKEDSKPTIHMLTQVERLIKANHEIPLIKNWKDFKLSTAEYIAFSRVIWDYLNGQDGTILMSLAEEIYDSASEAIRFSQGVMSEKSGLVKQNLVRQSQSLWGNNVELTLSQFAQEWVEKQGITLVKSKVRVGKNITEPENIPEKPLFYNPEIQRWVMQLEQTLVPENLNRIRERLRSRNMPVGINILLFGPPGTGKTETAMQLARKTGRRVMWVDISQTKSFFFGESEKKIRAIFTDYEKFAEKCETTPILLFNEADAVLGSRREGNHYAVDQTENAIQNILLECMEKFSGILMATTNLQGNLDSAFDRRFLYKLEFSEPDISVRIRILLSKIPQMEDQSAILLARQFRFTGGMIENLARKCEMFEILNGRFPDSKELLQFAAEEEGMRKKHLKPIGFTAQKE